MKPMAEREVAEIECTKIKVDQINLVVQRNEETIMSTVNRTNTMYRKLIVLLKVLKDDHLDGVPSMLSEYEYGRTCKNIKTIEDLKEFLYFCDGVYRCFINCYFTTVTLNVKTDDKIINLAGGSSNFEKAIIALKKKKRENERNRKEYEQYLDSVVRSEAFRPTLITKVGFDFKRKNSDKTEVEKKTRLLSEAKQHTYHLDNLHRMQIKFKQSNVFMTSVEEFRREFSKEKQRKQIVTKQKNKRSNELLPYTSSKRTHTVSLERTIVRVKKMKEIKGKFKMNMFALTASNFADIM